MKWRMPTECGHYELRLAILLLQKTSAFLVFYYLHTRNFCPSYQYLLYTSIFSLNTSIAGDYLSPILLECYFITFLLNLRVNLPKKDKFKISVLKGPILKSF